jgi:hypothetical protein
MIAQVAEFHIPVSLVIAAPADQNAAQQNPQIIRKIPKSIRTAGLINLVF